MIRIKNIIGNADPTVMRGEIAELRRAAGAPDALVDTEGLQEGPQRLECVYEERLAAPHILQVVADAAASGYDAITLDCFGDPALRGARELVDIPVIGSGLAGMLFAMTQGDRFSVITIQKGIGWMRENIRRYGFQERLASVRAVSIDLADLVANDATVQDALYREAERAMIDDGADVIVLGCTGMSAAAQPLAQRLGIPVVDPASCAVKLARSLVELGLSHSRRAYPRPPLRTKPRASEVSDDS